MISSLRKLYRAARGMAACRRGRGTVLSSTAVIDNVQRRADSIQLGEECIVQGQLLVFAHGGSIVIGDHCFIGENSRIWSGAQVTIGNRVLIAHDVNIFDNDTHPFEPGERHRHYLAIKHVGHPGDIDLGDRPVSIEDDVWIAAKAIVLKGVTIGRGAVVAAGAVVTKDVPSNVVVAGNPARIVRTLNLS